MEIGPYVALIALILGTPYMAYKKQWLLAGYFLLNVVAIVSGTFFGGTGLASTLTLASLVFLTFGIHKLMKQRKVSQSDS